MSEKQQRRYYSEKKKRHTQKTQIIMDRQTRRIICTAFANGRRHDFRLFKESRVVFRKETRCSADTGCQGLQKLHENCRLPKKRSRKNPLNLWDKHNSRAISSERCLVENVIRELKIFRILAEKYCNRRKRFALRFNLVAAFYNLEAVMNYVQKFERA